jgi:hypothetical protein
MEYYIIVSSKNNAMSVDNLVRKRVARVPQPRGSISGAITVSRHPVFQCRLAHSTPSLAASSRTHARHTTTP